MASSARQAAGKARGAAPTMPGSGETPDDVTLARKVETEIFRPADAPKGSVSVNAENGVVFLRGQVERPELVESLEARVRKVRGVKGIENLLHVPAVEPPAAS